MPSRLLMRAFALVFASVFASVAQAEDGSSDAARPITVWIQPIGTFAMPAVTAFQSAYGSAGIEVTQASGRIVVAELSAAVNHASSEPDLVTVGTLASVGLLIPLASSGKTSFFIQPKVIVGVGSHPDRFSESFERDVTADFGGGLDVGFRIELGAFVLEPVIGVSAGLSSVKPLYKGDSLFGATLFDIDVDGSRPSFRIGVNANLLRVGVRF